MAERSRLRILAGVAPIALTIGVSVAFYFFFTPEQLIEFIGVNNAYVLMWATALIGGLTTFNLLPYYSVLFILATSGLNPVALGLSSAIGVMTGDSYSYFIGRQGATVLPERMMRPFAYVRDISSDRPSLFRFICFLYGTFSPLSNDFLTIPAGVARVPYLHVIVPLALGNVIFNIAFAYLSVHAYGLLSVVFGA